MNTIVATKPEAMLLAHRLAEAEEHGRQAERHRTAAIRAMREAFDAIASAHGQTIPAAAPVRVIQDESGAITGFEIIDEAATKAE